MGRRPEQDVMIYGASGGVGLYAVQLAKAAGAFVTGVCSTRNTGLAKSAGCDKVVDYKTARLSPICEETCRRRKTSYLYRQGVSCK